MQFALPLHNGDGLGGSWRFIVFGLKLLVISNGLEHVCYVGGFHKSWHGGVGDDGNTALNLEHAHYLDSLVSRGQNNPKK